MAGNIILGGIIGAAIDGNSGATQELAPNPLVVTLEAEGGPAVAASEGIEPTIGRAPVS